MAKIVAEAENLINYEHLNKMMVKLNRNSMIIPDQLAIAWTNAALSENIE